METYNGKEVQAWCIGYRTETDGWKTINIPGDIDERTIERLLENINKQYPIVYTRKTEGMFEKESHRTEKGQFIGIE